MIVINARFLTQKMTGVQRYAFEICNLLPKKIGNKKIVLVAPKATIINKLDNDIDIVFYGNLKGQLWEQISLPIFLNKNKNPLLINFVGIAPVFYKRKVMFLYDLAFKHYPEWFSYSFQKPYNLLIPLSLKNSLKIITDSNYVKEDIHKVYKISNDNIYVIYAAPSVKFKNLNLKKEKFILTVSSIDPRKNLQRVIKAFNELNSDYKLVIVGSKSKTFSNIELNEKKYNRNIIFTGYLSDEDLIKLYNRAEVFIYASLFEGFGIPPLEAQACGTVCVVSNTTSLPEVYEDSVEYCDPHSIESIKNAIKKLLIDSNRRNQLKKKGEKNVNRFSWNDSTNRLVKKIEGIL
ncbi:MULTISPECIES: glycosyltransferase family 4 protein [Hwangdonia]|uniref:Glycosyltransferase family 4 protein n=1 Tax=Hwangdonia seohaensis TaxID=1240727 RepID=A0ABW3R8I6_9FLAO|nr:glycosyltransferase family 1 protein [Hwangdonia seohaensis]